MRDIPERPVLPAKRSLPWSLSCRDRLARGRNAAAVKTGGCDSRGNLFVQFDQYQQCGIAAKNFRRLMKTQYIRMLGQP